MYSPLSTTQTKKRRTMDVVDSVDTTQTVKTEQNYHTSYSVDPLTWAGKRGWGESSLVSTDTGQERKGGKLPGATTVGDKSHTRRCKRVALTSKPHKKHAPVPRTNNKLRSARSTRSTTPSFIGRTTYGKDHKTNTKQRTFPDTETSLHKKNNQHQTNHTQLQGQGCVPGYIKGNITTTISSSPSAYLPEARGIEARDVRVDLSHGVLKVPQILVQHPVRTRLRRYLFFVQCSCVRHSSLRLFMKT